MQILIQIALTLCIMLTTALTQKEYPYKAKIDAELQGNLLTATSSFTNHSKSEVRFTYQLSSKKSGKSGTSTNNQSGAVHAAPGQTVILSKTAFSVYPTDQYSLYLDILDNGVAVAKDTVMHPKADH